MTGAPNPLKNPRTVAAALLLAAMVVSLWFLPLDEWLTAASGWIRARPVTGIAVFLLVLVAGAVLMLPGSLLLLASGFIFGFWQGLALGSVALTAGAAAAMLAGRHFARDWVAAQTEGRPRFAALDAAIREQGLVVVILTRLSLLLPYNLLNYAYGLTGVTLRQYVIGTFAGMMPACALYVYLGSVARNAQDLVAGGQGPGGWLLIPGILALLAAMYVIHRAATRALNRSLDAGVSASDEPG